MSAELLLIGNPAKRKASPAQLRARAAFAAAARARSTKANPVKRHRKKHKVRHSGRARRNPIGGNALRGLMPMIKAAGLGGAGALASDVAYGFALPYLPAMIQSPLAEGGGINPAYYLGKGAFTVALGVMAKKVLGAKAATMTEGALAVLMHDGMKQFLGTTGVSVPMGYMPGGRILPPLPMGQGQPLRRGVGKYVSLPRAMSPGGGNGMRQMGMYVSPRQREGSLR